MEKSREEALKLLFKYNSQPFHIRHALIVESVMKYFCDLFALSSERDFWGTVGLLHDIDFEKYPEQHCIKAEEILRENGYSEKFIRAVVSHGYKLTVEVEPLHRMEKTLYAIDELTGLIGAVALMRPSKSVSDLEVSSVMKKFKNKAFAAGCDRDVIERGAKMLELPLDYLIEQTILAMRASENIINT